MKTILTLVADLFFETKIADTARHLGYAPATVMAGESPTDAIARTRPALFVIALEASEMLAAIDAARAAGIPSLAFGPHVRAELFAAARAAGCSQVVARSAMQAELPKLLARWAGQVDGNS